MKKNYMTSQAKPFRKAEETIVKVLDQQIHDALKLVKETQSLAHIEKLRDLLLKRKKTCKIPDSLKRQIYKYFLEREIQEMNFVKQRDQHTLRILKITKVKLKDYHLDWKKVLNKFEASTEETQKVTGIYDFLNHLRPYYDPNNIVEVFEHFKGRYSLSVELSWLYMEKFINITVQTTDENLRKFLNFVKQYSTMEELKDIHLWRWLLRIRKRRPSLDMAEEIEYLSNEIIKRFLIIHSKEKSSSSVNPKFIASAFATIIGRKNPRSSELLRLFIDIFKNTLVAFTQSKQNIKFIEVILLRIKDRKEAQDKIKKDIAKLEEQKKQQQESEEQKEEDDDEFEDSSPTLGGNVVVIEQSQSSSESDDEEETPKDKKLLKLKAKLSNELTTEILEELRLQLEKYIQDIFFIQSKSAAKALGYIYTMFPKMAENSIQFISKGVQIPELNVPILIKSTTKVLLSLLQHAQKSKILQYVLDILSEISKVRYIKEAWKSFIAIQSAIPILDEEDCAVVDDHQKEYFQKHFGMNHDRFYEKYSEIVFQAFKRLLSENQVSEKKKLPMILNPFTWLSTNSYKFFKKRCLKHAIQKYLETHSTYIHNFLDLNKIPKSFIEHFNHQTLPDYKSEQMEKMLEQLAFAAKSVEFSEIKRMIEMVGNNEHTTTNFNSFVRSVLTNWLYQNAYYRSRFRALKSNLEHFLPHHARNGQYFMANHDKQKVRDCLKLVVSLWKEYYNDVQKAINQIEKSPENLSSNSVEIIMKMHFDNTDIDYNVRKQLLWKVQFLKNIMEIFPYHKMLISQEKTLKNVDFEEFPQLKDLSSQSVWLVEKVIHVVLNRFPHDSRLVCILDSFASGLVINEETEFMMLWLDQKDVKKSVERSKKQGVPDYTSMNIQLDTKISLLNHAIAFQRDRKGSEPMFKSILIMTFHPDEGDLPINDPEINEKLTQIIRDLLHTKIPEGVQPNKKNKFQIKIAETLRKHSNQSRVIFKGEELVDLITVSIEMIGSTEKTVRQAFVSALKALIGKIETTKIDTKILEEKARQGINHGSPKQKVIWSLCLLLAANTNKEVNLSSYYKLFNDLIFEQDFLMRKTALFLNSILVRTKRNAEKKVTKFENLPPYEPLELFDFICQGYLRKEHENVHVIRKKLLKNYKGYYECEVVEKPLFPEMVTFLENPEKCRKFLINFHSDQISSEDELLMATRKVSVLKEITELSDILGWVIKKYTKTVKLTKHQMSIYERLVGQRYFKYLFEIDVSKNFINQDTGYRFFNTTKDLIKQWVEKIDTIDNQFVISVYMSTLLNAYEQVWRKAPNPEVEQFCREIIKKIIDHSSGQFWMIFCKMALNSNEEIDFLTKFFESFAPGNPSYYRALSKLLTYHTRRYYKQFQMLKNTINAKIDLSNSMVLKMVKSMITFPDKHYFNIQEAEKAGILKTDELLKNNKIEVVTKHLAIPTNYDFQEYLLNTLKEFLGSQQSDLRKVGSHLLFESINTCASLQKTQNSMRLLKNLLEIAVNWMTSNKEEFKTEQSQFQASLAAVLSQIFKPEDFKEILDRISRLLQPQTQTMHYLGIFYKNPYNFIVQSQEDYMKFIKSLLQLLESPILSKEVLLCISNLFYYRRLSGEKVLESFKSFTNNERDQVVLLMAMLLADVHNLRLYEDELNYILSHSNKEKDRVKVWAKLMVDSRGKAELIEEEDSKRQWNKIKSFSNPYFYHA